MSDQHHCHALRCDTPVPENALMCEPHWLMVPEDLRAAVLALYVPGQEVRKDPTKEYVHAAWAAVEAVADKEGIPRYVRSD